MPTHTVVAGETLSGLAEKYGFLDWRAIYDHPDNAALRKDRADPNVLYAGESVAIPEKKAEFPCETGKTHTFRLKRRASVWFRVSLSDDDGVPYGGARYELGVGAGAATEKTFTGRTDASGAVAHEVPATAKVALLKLWPADDVEEPLEFEIDLAPPAKPTELAGVQARLNDLGYEAGEPDGKASEATTAAVKAFQADLGHEPTGTLTPEETEALVAMHENRPAAA